MQEYHKQALLSRPTRLGFTVQCDGIKWTGDIVPGTLAYCVGGGNVTPPEAEVPRAMFEAYAVLVNLGEEPELYAYEHAQLGDRATRRPIGQFRELQLVLSTLVKLGVGATIVGRETVWELLDRYSFQLEL